jgi:K+-transporting ATPase KdpF subunit
MTTADVVFFVIIAGLLVYLAWALITPEDLQ